MTTLDKILGSENSGEIEIPKKEKSMLTYKSASDMTVRDPKNYRSGGRWKKHDRSVAGRRMWQKKSFKRERDVTALQGLEVEISMAENTINVAYDDLRGGHQSSFALVEESVKLYGKNPDHFSTAFEEGA